MQQIATAVFMDGKMAGRRTKSKGGAEAPPKSAHYWAGAAGAAGSAAGSAGAGFSGAGISEVTSGEA